jgi:hypothetical protein
VTVDQLGLPESHPWHPANLEVVKGPESAAIYDGLNDHLITLPIRWWAMYERRYDDPKLAFVEAMKEKAQEEMARDGVAVGSDGGH